jgi:antagonist of KipI
MTSLHVNRSGLHTTVQDLGRWGLQAYGVPVAGAMDAWSHRIANALVGNSPDSATLEITLIGPEIQFEDARVVAVSGAMFDLTLDGSTAAMNAAFSVSPGSLLRFGMRSSGARAYLAVSGGIDVPRVFGSRSTHVPSGMGGLDGRALKAGDRVPLGQAAAPLRRDRESSLSRGTASAIQQFIPLRGGLSRLRVIPGPQRERFSQEAMQALQSAPYTIATESDRMGFRLHGPSLQHADDPDILSDATPLGALQVPASGQPVLLMADRQTTGGYPKIATVISADVGVAGQLAPGDAISFEVCEPRSAIAVLIAAERALMAIEAGP